MVDLEALVPKEHLLRKIERVMDYEWLYKRLTPYSMLYRVKPHFLFSLKTTIGRRSKREENKKKRRSSAENRRFFPGRGGHFRCRLQTLQSKSFMRQLLYAKYLPADNDFVLEFHYTHLKYR